MKYKVGDWVYTYFARIPRVFKCKVVRVTEEEYGIFKKSKRFIYWLQVPEQDWTIGKEDHEIAPSMSELVYRNG